MPRSTTPRSLASAALAAFVITLAGSGSLFAQSAPPPQPKPEPFVFAKPELTIELDQEALKAQVEALKSTIDHAKFAEAAKAFNEEMVAKIHSDLDFKFQVDRGPKGPVGPVIVRTMGRGDNNEDRFYQAGTRALDGARWDEAVAQFQRAAALNGPRADGATYWTAWALNKQGDSAGALAALNKLRQTFPNSKWITESRALEVEVRQATGQPVRPESVPDDEVKLMAINSVMRANEERAIPMIDKILRGTGSPHLKERALFVLAQNGTPQARQIVLDIAKGAGNPDLQARAVTYLGALGGAETRQALPEIYKASTSIDVKRNILHAFMVAGDRARLLEVAKTEPSADLRSEAIQQLGAMGAQDELSQLYQSETSSDVKKRIIQSMFTGHNEAKLTQLLRTEADEDLKKSIVQNLGMMATPTSAEALTSVYAADKNEAVRRAVIDAFGQQRNSKALVDLAKKETDPALKRRIVERLSSLKSTEATDYFLELLSKP